MYENPLILYKHTYIHTFRHKQTNRITALKYQASSKSNRVFTKYLLCKNLLNAPTCKHSACKGASQTTNQPPTIKLRFPHSPNLEHWEWFSMTLGKTASQRKHSLPRISAHEESGDHFLHSLICRESSRILTDNDETSKPGSTAAEELSQINAHVCLKRMLSVLVGPSLPIPQTAPGSQGTWSLPPSRFRPARAAGVPPPCLSAATPGLLCLHLRAENP